MPLFYARRVAGGPLLVCEAPAGYAVRADGAMFAADGSPLIWREATPEEQARTPKASARGRAMKEIVDAWLADEPIGGVSRHGLAEAVCGKRYSRLVGKHQVGARCQRELGHSDDCGPARGCPEAKPEDPPGFCSAHGGYVDRCPASAGKPS